MPKVLAPDVFRQHFDNSGNVLNGGKIETYEGGTSTPATTWTSSAGDGLTGAQANPIVLDAYGREPGGIWITKGTAYKFVLKTSAGVTLDTVDNIVVGEIEEENENQYLISLSYSGTPGAQAAMGIHSVTHAFTFPADFDGASGDVLTNPGAEYVIAIQKNGVEIGSASIDDTGVFTFETVGGASYPCIFGDCIAFIAPDSGSAANFGITLVGDL